MSSVYEGGYGFSEPMDPLERKMHEMDKEDDAKLRAEIRALRAHLAQSDAQGVSHMREVARLRSELAALKSGTRIEGFVSRDDLEQWLGHKAEARSTSMVVWTYAQRFADVAVLLLPGEPSEPASYERDSPNYDPAKALRERGYERVNNPREQGGEGA